MTKEMNYAINRPVMLHVRRARESRFDHLSKRDYHYHLTRCLTTVHAYKDARLDLDEFTEVIQRELIPIMHRDPDSYQHILDETVSELCDDTEYPVDELIDENMF